MIAEHLLGSAACSAGGIPPVASLPVAGSMPS